MQIVPSTVGDAEAVTDLHLDVWEEAYAGLVAAEILAERRRTRSGRVERWRSIIASERSTELIAHDDTGLVGFVSSGAGRDDPETGLPEVEVRALYVRSRVYGSGVGFALLDAAIGTSPAYLWVLAGNGRAVRFYERQGFAFDGCAKVEPVGLERRMVRGSNRPRA